MLDKLFFIHNNTIKSTPLKFKRYLYGVVDWRSRSICITGSRGTGKTTMLLQIMHSLPVDHHEKLYISLENIYFLENRLFQVADQFVGAG